MSKFVLQGRHVNREWLELRKSKHAIFVIPAAVRWLLRAWEVRIRSND